MPNAVDLTRERRRTIEPILRAAEILRAFGSDGATLRVRDLVDRTGLHKATVSRLAQSLEIAGLIERAEPVGFRSLTSLTRRKKLRIGYASQNEQAQFPAQITESLRRAARIYDTDLMVFDNHFDAKTTLRNVDAMVRQKVDVVILFSTIESIAAKVSARLSRAQIPLIAIEMPIHGAPFYGANNYAAGRTAGLALARFARRHWKSHVAHVLLIELPEAGALPQLRLDGAMDSIKEIIPSLQDHQFVHINGRNDFEHSYSSVRQWLRKTAAGNCLIAAINDPSALGAIAAFRQLQPSGQCVAVGQNATPAARLEMRKRGSSLIGSVAYQPERYGAEVMRMAIHLARQLPVPPAAYARHCMVSATNVDRLFPEDRELR